MKKFFLLKLNYEINEKSLNFLLSLCENEKKEQILRKKKKEDVIRSLAGNALAKYAIEKSFGISAKNQRFGYEKSGKPYFLKRKDIYFSISHSDRLVGCAVSDEPVGIDIQKKRKYSERLAKRLNAKNEDEFFSLWTKREAFIKKTGSGIFSAVVETPVDSEARAFVYDDYYISVI